MNFPSGDHTGLDETESTRRTGAPPSAGIMKRRAPCLSPSSAATASHFPSGDHDAALCTSSDSARGFAPLASGAAQKSLERRSRRIGKQTRWPSGERAAAPITAPWVDFQISFAPPPLRRHSPSAPPREARYHRDESRPNRGAADRAVGTVSRVAAASSATSLLIGTLHSSTLGFETAATRRRGCLGATTLAEIEM